MSTFLTSDVKASGVLGQGYVVEDKFMWEVQTWESIVMVPRQLGT